MRVAVNRGAQDFGLPGGIRRARACGGIWDDEGAGTWHLFRPSFKESKALMIEWFMFGALGFFLGCLLGLMLAPPLWNRAVKLTTRRLEATMPMTLADIQADKDQIRADFAIQLRKVEVALEKSKEKAARELIEANKRRVEIQMLNGNLDSVKGELQEAENANRVLQQTIKRRLPDLDARLKAAKKALSELETVNAELRNTVASQSDALKVARATVHNQRADIDQLRLSLESGSAAGRGSAKADSRAVAESQRLAAELSRAREELDQVRTSSEEIAFLRRELSHLASQIMDAARYQPATVQTVAAPQADYEEETDVAAEALAEAQALARAESAAQAEAAALAAQEMAAQEMAGAEGAAVAHETVAYTGNGAAEPGTEYAGAEHGGTHTAEDGYPAEEAYAAGGIYQAEEDYRTEPAQEDAGQTYTAEAGYAAEEASAAEQSFEDVESYELEEDYETYEIEGADTARHVQQAGNDPRHGDEDASDDGQGQAGGQASEHESQKRSLSQRFAMRRSKRQGEKSGGSLTSRLRGLVADSPETRG
ncbi:MAG: hypothetical protein A49_09280 [Methyloceanibacter sp.]|nr:MAG: hypothetical protein A49_09280 [Methyloceanibacter sp.]